MHIAKENVSTQSHIPNSVTEPTQVTMVTCKENQTQNLIFFYVFLHALTRPLEEYDKTE